MRCHRQRTIMGWYVLRPRVRVYRHPLLIWIRWLDWSLFIDRAPALTGKDGTNG